MLIPSIDIMGGRAVQLVGGERFELDCGDPLELAARFSVLGELAVVDLDAAPGSGSTLDLVAKIASHYPCRVGGGVRDERTMTRLLDAGARSVMVGTMASPAFLSAFPKDRLVAALDNKKGVVMADGWKTSTGESVAARAAELAPHVGGFHVTAIDIDASLSGIDVAAARRMVEALRKTGFDGNITMAGGITGASGVAVLDGMGVDVQVGMGLYKAILDPAEAMAACMNTDRPDGLWPTVVRDESGVALGLVYSDLVSLRAAMAERAGVYHSRKRGLWRKGESSGDSQVLVRIDADCDRDALRFTVRQNGAGFCHRGTRKCFGASGPDGFGSDRKGFQLLSATTAKRPAEVSGGLAPKGSYTARLFAKSGLLAANWPRKPPSYAKPRDQSGPPRKRPTFCTLPRSSWPAKERACPMSSASSTDARAPGLWETMAPGRTTPCRHRQGRELRRTFGIRLSEDTHLA